MAAGDKLRLAQLAAELLIIEAAAAGWSSTCRRVKTGQMSFDESSRWTMWSLPVKGRERRAGFALLLRDLRRVVQPGAVTGGDPEIV